MPVKESTIEISHSGIVSEVENIHPDLTLITLQCPAPITLRYYGIAQREDFLGRDVVFKTLDKGKTVDQVVFGADDFRRSTSNISRYLIEKVNKEYDSRKTQYIFWDGHEQIADEKGKIITVKDPNTDYLPLNLKLFPRVCGSVPNRDFFENLSEIPKEGEHLVSFRGILFIGKHYISDSRIKEIKQI